MMLSPLLEKMVLFRCLKEALITKHLNLHKKLSYNFFNVQYESDDWSNVNSNIQNKVGEKLLHLQNHPLYHLKNKIKHFFSEKYKEKDNTPLFQTFDDLNPIVTTQQNFDKYIFDGIYLVI